MPKKQDESVDYFDQLAEDWLKSRPELMVGQCSMLLRVIRLAGILERDLVRICREFGINTGQFQVLAALRRKYPKPVTPTDLSRIAILTTGTMTILLDRLEEKGLARRIRHSTDRRSVEVEMTEAGKKLIDQAIERRVAALIEMQSALDAQDRESASQTLRKLLVVLDTPIDEAC